ncbi:MAG TPA: pilus assembly protein [Firmicutes bacterium]|nr:pilus assembly protein [Bacillota bacterium]
MKNNNGQAMTEFVVVIPVFILLLVFMVQFTKLSIKRTELVMVEREVMRALTDNKDHSDRGKIQEMAKEIASLYGMDPERLSVRTADTQQDITAETAGEEADLGGNNLFDFFTGVKFEIVYEMPLMPVFENLTTIKLKSSLVSAAGGSLGVEFFE